MIRELDTAVLTEDLPAFGLHRGDLGAVVHSYQGGASYEVEFVDSEGKTIALTTLSAGQIRPRHAGEILCVREYSPTGP